MNYTNKYNIPEHICSWLAADEYDYLPGVYSATTLISPARAFILKKRNAENLTMDYSDFIKMRMGTAIHDSLEKIGVYADGDFKEKRFFAEIMGCQISGKMDAVLGGVIRDNKSTSVWKYVKKEFDDYIKQLSIYRWILYRNGINTEQYAFIDFFFTDWKKSDAEKSSDYPQIPYQEQKIDLLSLEATEELICDRLEEFTFAESVLPECTAEELWQRDECWAVFTKEGQARAKKLCKTEEEAKEYASANGCKYIEHRPGKAVRCGYCSAAPFCDQCKEMQKKGLVDLE